MERRSDRIHERHEQANRRQVHEVEGQVAPPPRGRQNRGNHGHHNQRHGQSQEDNILIVEEVHEEGEDEVEQNIGNDLVQGEEPLPPPPT